MEKQRNGTAPSSALSPGTLPSTLPSTFGNLGLSQSCSRRPRFQYTFFKFNAYKVGLSISLPYVRLVWPRKAIMGDGANAVLESSRLSSAEAGGFGALYGPSTPRFSNLRLGHPLLRGPLDFLSQRLWECKILPKARKINLRKIVPWAPETHQLI